jgi:hypothetical protein
MVARWRSGEAEAANGEITGVKNYFHVTTWTRPRGRLGGLGLAASFPAAMAARRGRAHRRSEVPAKPGPNRPS